MGALREVRTPWLAAHVAPLPPRRDLFARRFVRVVAANDEPPDCASHKLTREQVEAIRIAWAAREAGPRLRAVITQVWLGRHFGVSHVAIWKVVHGVSYGEARK